MILAESETKVRCWLYFELGANSLVEGMSYLLFLWLNLGPREKRSRFGCHPSAKNSFCREINAELEKGS